MNQTKPNATIKPSMDIVLAFLVFVACILYAIFYQEPVIQAATISGLGWR
jgi:hypothetical protein